MRTRAKTEPVISADRNEQISRFVGNPTTTCRAFCSTKTYRDNFSAIAKTEAVILSAIGFSLSCLGKHLSHAIYAKLQETREEIPK
jgi:hypothetical protein